MSHERWTRKGWKEWQKMVVKKGERKAREGESGRRRERRKRKREIRKNINRMEKVTVR